MLTARQSKKNLYEELDQLGLSSFFDCILVTETLRSKEELLIEAKIDKQDNDLFVTDMGNDLNIGKKLGYRTVGITHGFMRRERLLEYSPDIIIDNLSEILDLI